MKEKVVVGMSGGVDSFMAALFLLEEGYKVIGVNLRLWGENDTQMVETNCRELGIPLIYRDGQSLFRELVVGPFVREYLQGRTPSPCCICNRSVKWQLLAAVAREQEVQKIATGHYVRLLHTGDKHYILKGKDAVKDQSYFLWGIPQGVLAGAITPLGEYTKAQVKEKALERGYPGMVRKRESMGICFLAGQDYRNFIEAEAGQLPGKRGCIVDRKGVVLGEHAGIFHFTIGQKQGLPVRNGQPLYVAEIDVMRNEIVVDVKNGLLADTLVVSQAEFVDRNDLLASDVEIKIRGVGVNPAGFVRIEELADKKLRVRLAEPAWAAAPGQPVAFYRGDILLGGGILCGVEA